jgi:hypothetical protein
VEKLLQRLLIYASIFHKNNIEKWPHLKNREDFDNVYELDSHSRCPLERIYFDGRDLAVFMSHQLEAFNNPDSFPTLKKYVDSFDNGWLYEIDFLRDNFQKAKDIFSTLERQLWSVKQMIDLFDEQISLLEDVKKTFNGLRESDIYKFESGNVQSTFPVTEYSKILDCIHSIGKTFERLPNTYADKDEESLRDLILVALQPNVVGSATGETLNKLGKTDILVRNVNNNEFIGECKFWHGQEGYKKTIDQLISYLSWRDNKTAIIIFVKNKNFSNVINQIDDVTAQHPYYLRTLSPTDKTWHNYELRMNAVESRVLKMAVMLYHLPKHK